MEKKFFADATFERLWVVSFQTVKEPCTMLGLYDSSLDFQRR